RSLLRSRPLSFSLPGAAGLETSRTTRIGCLAVGRTAAAPQATDCHSIDLLQRLQRRGLGLSSGRALILGEAAFDSRTARGCQDHQALLAGIESVSHLGFYGTRSVGFPLNFSGSNGSQKLPVPPSATLRLL